MSRLRAIRNLLTLCFPRVSGDEPLSVAIEGGSLTFSPRERG